MSSSSPEASASTIDEASDVDAKTKTALELERLTAHLIGLIAAREFTHPDLDRYVVPNFTAYVEHTKEPVVTSRKQLFARYKEVTAENPDYASEIQSVSADVDEKKGTAVVWITLRITAQEIQKQSVTLTYWERIKGQWRCFMQDGIRGMGGDI